MGGKATSASVTCPDLGSDSDMGVIMSSLKCGKAIYMNAGFTPHKPLLSTCNGLDFTGPQGLWLPP